MNAPSRSRATPISRRRKIRKGTFSCWECKRRKKRCEIKPPATKCLFCRQRDLPCRSQEFEEDDQDDQDDQETGHGAAARLRHVEDLVEQLVHQRQVASMPTVEADRFPLVLSSPSKSTISISSYLHSVFPSPEQLNSVHFQGNYAHVSRQILRLSSNDLSQTSKCPPPGAHPLQFALQLIHYALCLQQSDNAPEAQLKASNCAEMVSRHVSSLDVLMDSPQGVELLLLEVVFYSNKGDQKASWLRSRRAIAIAQLVGMNQLNGVDGKNATKWRRLLTCDRFLSLDLGLPHVPDLEDGFCGMQSDDFEKFENMLIHVSGRVIFRNMRWQRHGIDLDYTETQALDSVMKRATRILPAGWWALTSQLHTMTDEAFRLETGRILLQLNHYWLLLNLHLPYLVYELRDQKKVDDASYSKSVIPATCREVLQCVINIRSCHIGSLYRGLDAKAYITSAALLLAHINGHGAPLTNMLEHQRPQDLDLVKKALGILGNDNSAETLKWLLQIESEVANGEMYTWDGVKQGGAELVLPYLGVLRALRVALPEPHVGDLQHSLNHPSNDDLERPGNVFDGNLPDDMNVWDICEW
ncbi:hypothetical protein B0I35DRAFT_108493 [Stachybotrys elegans]|uniref:Zn(2)-C6 fungal-type domain-containing protein n=1 Tax=Stachybotrys elegans TaxID=80388 RepID=A0A8K0SBJ4_9HYPO|nr:hypothetical protein B0I35DRAFT_108493 [Stachybotrys elegans]